MRVPVSIAAVALALATCSSAQALERDRVQFSEGNTTLALSPPRTMLDVRPGQRLRLGFVVTNRTRETIDATVRVSDLAPAPGDESFAVTAKGASRGAASWLDPEVRSLRLQSGERVRMHLAVQVPEDARPGVWAAAVQIVRKLLPEDSGTGVTTEAALGNQWLFTVAGEARTSARLDDPAAPRFVSAGADVEISAVLVNEGETLLQPPGEVRLGAFLGTAGQELALQPVPVLPGGRRELAATWRETPWIGRFEPSLHVELQDGSRLSYEYPAVWVLPPIWFWVALAICLAVPLAARRQRRRRGHRDDEPA